MSDTGEQNRFRLALDAYAATARQAVADGCVLLKNEQETLPLRAGDRVAVFGRTQVEYCKSGTGSGGLVNTRYVSGILDALSACPEITIDLALQTTYQQWLLTHPFDSGTGWAQEPWSQEEMPVSDTLAAAAAGRTDVALIIVGRTAGEDRDNKAESGSYLLTEAEESMIATVCRHFSRVAAVLNTGNILDMKWVDTYAVPAVLLAWQGGMEGGNGLADVLTGSVSPSGRLTDTISIDITDHPSTANFGGESEAVYAEDIYVGYRYFETFAPERVRFPFGYGLSYTRFDRELIAFHAPGSDKVLGDDALGDTNISVSVRVVNRGDVAGREVVQMYASAPQGQLGKPARVLAAFAKTALLPPGGSEEITLAVRPRDLASYDDGGVTGHKACWVLEAGTYRFFVGGDVRSAVAAGNWTCGDLIVTERLSEAAAPVKPFNRLKPVIEDGRFVKTEEPVPLRSVHPEAGRRAARPEDLQQTGDCGWRLADVADGRVSADAWVAQLSDEDLACVVRGEGMSSPKVTPGTASAFGGVTESLAGLGLPLGCCADGPSGIRMDCGTHAFSLPNGTSLACTFDFPLVARLFTFVGLELRKNQIDTLLGPGMNIHRNPLNGRNFEYFSEDPLLTGRMAVAQLKGLHEYGVTGTVKHFACNNQEFRRHDIDSVVSERALREIYLKGFEMAVREGGAFSVMSTYGSLNGLWTAGHYELLTTILRGQWGFDGIVMTDWWAKINDEGAPGRRNNTAAMVRAQNDLYMVVSDAGANSANDNTAQALADGSLTRGELQRCARNIVSALVRLPVAERSLGRVSEAERAQAEHERTEGVESPPFDLAFHEIGRDTLLEAVTLNTGKGATNLLGLTFREQGSYTLQLRMRSFAGELAQIPLSVFVNNVLVRTVTISGTDGEWVSETLPLGPFFNPHVFLKLYFGQSGMEVAPLHFLFCAPLG